MKTILTIAKKELKAYFVTPIAYIYLIAFLVLAHWFFLRSFFLIGQATLRGLFELIPWLFLFFVPAVSMGKWAEEKKQGTMELLFTLPIREQEVVLGKFLAGLGLIATALFFTLPLMLTALLLGNLDFGPVVGGYVGAIFLGAAYLAIGLWISSLTDNQIIAFIVGVIVCFIFFILGEQIVTAGLSAPLAGMLQALSLGAHFDSIGRGLIDSRDILYYFSMVVLFLFLNWKAIEGRLWK